MSTLSKIAKFTAVLTAAAFWASAASAAIEVKQAWVVSHEGEGVLYMTIANTGGAPDHLYAVKADVAKRSKLHMEMKSGPHSAKAAHGHADMKTMSMMKIEPGHPVQLTAAGSHILLQQLKGKLTSGQKVAVKLFFKKAGTVKVEATVK